jgi:hypothetical protein
LLHHHHRRPCRCHMIGDIIGTLVANALQLAYQEITSQQPSSGRAAAEVGLDETFCLSSVPTSSCPPHGTGRAVSALQERQQKWRKLTRANFYLQQTHLKYE